VSLNSSDTPDLIAQDPPTSTSPGHTLYLKIDLKVEPMGGKPVPPLSRDPNRYEVSEPELLRGLKLS
jgi:hypothetical protein